MQRTICKGGNADSNNCALGSGRKSTTLRARAIASSATAAMCHCNDRCIRDTRFVSHEGTRGNARPKWAGDRDSAGLVDGQTLFIAYWICSSREPFARMEGDIR